MHLIIPAYRGRNLRFGCHCSKAVASKNKPGVLLFILSTKALILRL